MKKIGIMTMSSGANGLYGCNYGAALQGYALIEYLRSCGFEAWDLNYNSEYEYHPNQYSGLEKAKKRLQLLFNYKAVKGKLLSYKNKSGIQANKAAFDRFVRENNLTYSEGKFYSYQDLANVSSEFYAFITGSDVVWDPYNHQGQNDEGYFLNFCDQGVRRLAYAPSIGVTSLPDTAERNLKELLIQFDALSIREKSGAELIKNVTGLSVPVVLDPTLLVDRHVYDKIKRRKISLPDEYIAVYKFGEIEYTDEIVRLISERLNLPVVLIPSRYDSKFKTYWDIGPGEFIEVIKNARLVLTDSFHCTIFSLINHTPFLLFMRSKPDNAFSTHSRLSDLIELFNLQDRYMAPGQTVDFETLLTYDFSHFETIVSERQTDSRKYLEKALS